MRMVVAKEKPDRMIHLGDHSGDAEALHRQYKTIPIDIVKGNNDYTNIYPSAKQLQIDEKRIFITHGDLFGVKYGVDRIVEKGRSEGVDIVLFGHTHKPYLFKHGEMWVMNPGSVGYRSVLISKATYGMIDLNAGITCCEIREV